VIKIIKRFMDAVEILEIGEHQELALGKSFSLVNGQGSGIIFIVRLSKTAECKQQYYRYTGNHPGSAMFSHCVPFSPGSGKSGFWNFFGGLVTLVWSSAPGIGYGRKK
jgi:hypothetical protein